MRLDPAAASKGQDWLFWTVQQTLIFPLLLLAGVLLPVGDDTPGWLRFLADVNPLTYIVGAERALFAGEFPLDFLLAGVGAAVAVAVFGLVVERRAPRGGAARRLLARSSRPTRSHRTGPPTIAVHGCDLADSGLGLCMCNCTCLHHRPWWCHHYSRQ
ncbi:MAG: ABC transporter permease [Dermatophilaceae bacterium]